MPQLSGPAGGSASRPYREGCPGGAPGLPSPEPCAALTEVVELHDIVADNLLPDSIRQLAQIGLDVLA